MSSTKGGFIDPIKLVAVIFILAGGFSLAYGKFSFTEEKHTAKVGDVAISVDERRTIDLPKWLGVSAVVVGSLLLLIPASRRVL